MPERKMRPSIKWGLLVSGALLVLALIAVAASMIVEGDPAIGLRLLTLLPVIVTFGVFTAIGIEVVRLFVLTVRFLERKTNDPGW